MPFYTTVRATLKDKDPEQAKAAHNAVVDKLLGKTQAAGGLSHLAYANPQDPAEFLAMDTWQSLEGMQEAFGDPETQAAIGGLFEEMPEIKVWMPREGWTSF